MGTDVVGTEVARTDVVGTEVVGADTSGADCVPSVSATAAAGADVDGTETSGTDVVGTETSGREVVGTETSGIDVAGADASDAGAASSTSATVADVDGAAGSVVSPMSGDPQAAAPTSTSVATTGVNQPSPDGYRPSPFIARLDLRLRGHADRRRRLGSGRGVSRSCSLRSRAARATASPVCAGLAHLSARPLRS